jgi:hypothetical protein
MITTLAASLALAAFPGGNVSDLARSIAEETKQNVVFQAGAAETAKAFEYDPNNLNEMARAILAGSGFKRAPGAEHVFHHGRLGGWMFGLQAVQRVAQQDETWRAGGAWPADALKDGKVTLKNASGSSFSIESIPKDLLPKPPLEIHWIFERSALKAYVTELPAMDFANYVAKAVGGKVLARQDRYILDIDPVEIQRRAVATLTEVQKAPNYMQMDARRKGQVLLSRAVLGGLSGPQISALLSTPQGSLRFEIGPASRPAVQNYAQALIQSEGQEEVLFAQEQQTIVQERRAQRGNDEGRNNRNMSLILRRADPRILGYTTINARFEVRVELLVLDNQGRPGRLVPLP